MYVFNDWVCSFCVYNNRDCSMYTMTEDCSMFVNNGRGQRYVCLQWPGTALHGTALHGSAMTGDWSMCLQWPGTALRVCTMTMDCSMCLQWPQTALWIVNDQGLLYMGLKLPGTALCLQWQKTALCVYNDQGLLYPVYNNWGLRYACLQRLGTALFVSAITSECYICVCSDWGLLRMCLQWLGTALCVDNDHRLLHICLQWLGPLCVSTITDDCYMFVYNAWRLLCVYNGQGLLYVCLQWPGTALWVHIDRWLYLCLRWPGTAPDVSTMTENCSVCVYNVRDCSILSRITGNCAIFVYNDWGLLYVCLQ